MTPVIKRLARLLALSLLLPGLLMTWLGLSRAGGGLATWLTGESAEGTVTDVRTTRASGRPGGLGYRQASVITFTTGAGEVVTFEHPVQSTRPPFARGERVRVFYRPEAPGDAVAPGGLAWIVFGWGFVASAGIALLVSSAAIMLIAALPWRRRHVAHG